MLFSLLSGLKVYDLDSHAANQLSFTVDLLHAGLCLRSEFHKTIVVPKNLSLNWEKPGIE